MRDHCLSLISVSSGWTHWARSVSTAPLYTRTVQFLWCVCVCVCVCVRLCHCVCAPVFLSLRGPVWVLALHTESVWKRGRLLKRGGQRTSTTDSFWSFCFLTCSSVELGQAREIRNHPSAATVSAEGSTEVCRVWMCVSWFRALSD